MLNGAEEPKSAAVYKDSSLRLRYPASFPDIGDCHEIKMDFDFRILAGRLPCLGQREIGIFENQRPTRPRPHR